MEHSNVKGASEGLGHNNAKVRVLGIAKCIWSKILDGSLIELETLSGLNRLYNYH